MKVDWRNMIYTVKEDPVFCFVRFLSLFYHVSLAWRKNVVVGKGLRLKGWPIIETIEGGRVTIGDNVTLYSSPRQYFAVICSPVRLFAEENGRIAIGDNSRVNGATVHARSTISIGKNCLIAANTSIIDSHGHSLCLDNPEQRINSVDEPCPIKIGDNVWIGMNCLILKGVEIGAGAVIGAHNVITKNIAPASLVQSPKNATVKF